MRYTLAGQLAMRQLCPIIDRGHFIIHKVTQTRSVLTQKVFSRYTHTEERGGGREFGASMTFIGWKRFREPSRLTYFLVNKTGVRREKRAELAEDTLLGAITTAISETNRI